MRIVVGLAVALAAVAAFAGPGAPDAAACSCVSADPAEFLPQADAAFVGRVLEHRVDEPFLSSAETAYWTFAVERAVKGSVPRRLVVATAASGASCGLELSLGQRLALLVERRGDEYASNLCWQTDPHELARHRLAGAEVIDAPAEQASGGGAARWPFGLAGGAAAGVARGAAGVAVRRRSASG